MNKYYHLDWFRYSVDYEQDSRTVLPPHVAFLPDKERQVPQMVFYDRTEVLHCARIDWREGAPGQRKLITMTGENCAMAHINGVSDTELIAHAVAIPNVTFTRVDLACDIIDDTSHDIDQIYRSYRRGRAKTSAKKCSRIQERQGRNAGGITVYIGSRQSEKFLRVYDKGIQMGQGEPGQWIRVELETKSGFSQRVILAANKEGLIPITKEAIRDFIETGVEWFDACFYADAEGRLIDIGARKDTDWERWVIKVALPAVCKAIEMDISEVREGVLDAFLKRNKKV